jgi:hypothetical protein
MKRKLLDPRLLTALLSLSLPIYLGSLACEVKVCDDDDTDCGVVDRDPSGGSTGIGGAESMGAAGAGEEPMGQAGAASLIEAEEPGLDCHENGKISGTLGDTSPVDDESDEDYACQECAERLCSEELAKCYATGPDSVCLYGTTSLMDDTGEVGCMLTCFLELEDDFTLLEIDVEECASQCGATECTSQTASLVTQDLMRCFLDTSGTDPEELGCVAECGLDIYL